MYRDVINFDEKNESHKKNSIESDFDSEGKRQKVSVSYDESEHYFFLTFK